MGSDAQRLMWIFLTQGLILANISAGESSPDWINNSKQYKERLSLLLDKSLMLSNLTTEDSGCYEAEVKSVSGRITTQKFNLTVHEPESAKPNGKLWITVLIVILVISAFVIPAIVYLIIAYVFYPILRGTHRKCILHNEEFGPEEN